jgi:hypothetical protein
LAALLVITGSTQLAKGAIIIESQVFKNIVERDDSNMVQGKNN